MNKKFLLSLILFALSCNNSSFAQVPSGSNNFTQALIDAIYQNKELISDDDNYKFLLKGTLLKPARPSNEYSVVFSALDNSLLKNRMVKSVNSVIKSGELNTTIAMQCIMQGATVLSYDESSSLFTSRAGTCYRTLSNDDTESAAIADSLFSKVAQDSDLASYAKAAWYKMAVNFCEKDSTSGLQASLEPCSANAAKKLFEDLHEWWNSHKNNTMKVAFSAEDKLIIDRDFCRNSDLSSCVDVTVDDAKTAIADISSTIDLILDKFKANLVADVAEHMTALNVNVKTSVERFLDADKVGPADSVKACWTTDDNAFNLQIDNLSIMKKALNALDANFESVKAIAPVIPLDQDHYIGVSDNKADKIDVVNGASLLNSDKYWKDKSVNSTAYTDALAQRKLLESSVVKNQADYFTKARNAAVVKSVAMANIKHLIGLRTANASFAVPEGANCPSKRASVQEWMKVTAMKRNNPKWALAVKNAQLADVMKQAVLILAEMRTQAYLNNQLLQRILMTNSVRLLNISNEDMATTNNTIKTIKKDIDAYVVGGAASSDESEAAAEAISAAGVEAP